MIRPDVTLSQAWHFPTPTVMSLPTGLTVWHVHLPGQHLATFELVLPVALAAEPRDREGLGTVALHAIDEGTVSHPDGRIGELLEGQGATLHGTARLRYTTFGGQAPIRRLPEVLRLFVEVLAEPEYAERDVAHHIEAQVAAYDSKLASPGPSARLALRRELYGAEHREGRPAAGTPATLGQLTAADAHAWHRRHFTPDGAVLLVAGDLPDPAPLSRLADWVGPGRGSGSTPAPAPDGRSRIVVVDRPGSVQATILIGRRSVPRSHERWPALRLAGHAVVGAFASRLNLELRERLGYSYGIGGGFSPGVGESQFTVGGSVRTEVAADAVARLLDGLELRDPFTAAEIDDARRYLVGVAPLANETSADIVGQASALAAAGLDAGYMNRHFADLGVVTPAQATEAFRDEVRPDTLTVAVAGAAEELLPALAARGLAAEVVDLRD